MNPVMLFVLCCLACWRICHFVSREDGPLHFMWDIRYYLQKEGQSSRPTQFLFELISCVNCLSVWISIYFALAVFMNHFLISWLAISSVVMILEKIYGMLWLKSGSE